MRKYIVVVEAKDADALKKVTGFMRGLSRDGFSPATHYWAVWLLGSKDKEFEISKMEAAPENIMSDLAGGQWFDANAWTPRAILERLDLKEIPQFPEVQ